MDVWKNFFLESVVKYWNRLSREVMESPPLEGGMHEMAAALTNMVQRWDSVVEGGGWT